MNDWSEDIENVLEQMRMNCVILAKQHKKQYFYLNNILLYFRLPVIIISGINSIVSVGLQPYVNQGMISMMTCLLALSCSIIGSIELYLAIQKSMENELLASKDYYILSIDLHKTLTLSSIHRPIPAKDYLEKKYNEYVKLCENSNLLSKKIIDSLNPLPEHPYYSITRPSSRTRYAIANGSDEESVTSLPAQQPSSLFDDDTSSLHFKLPQLASVRNPLEIIASMTKSKIPLKSFENKITGPASAPASAPISNIIPLPKEIDKSIQSAIIDVNISTEVKKVIDQCVESISIDQPSSEL